ncbi:hypothetical protein Vadar_016792 [Vaccinium darrowii]|uniref:Uncharacterized protein n=1 Tax=Vaccinium darrowii TaxID=229202 RepID=A0ACB7ZL47_9ERIC|nr:hypothetical protein Vadar_016792 [Vaccinium darrowii]
MKLRDYGKYANLVLRPSESDSNKGLLMSVGFGEIDLNSDAVNGEVHGVDASESTVGFDGQGSEGLGSVGKENGTVSAMGHLERKNDEILAGIAVGGQIGVNDSAIGLGLSGHFQGSDALRGVSTCSESNQEGLKKSFNVVSEEAVVGRGGESISVGNAVEREVAAVFGSQHVEVKPDMGGGGAVDLDLVYGGVKAEQLLREGLNLVRAEGEWKLGGGIGNEGNAFESIGNQGVVFEAQTKDTQQSGDIEIENVKQGSQVKELWTGNEGQFHMSDLVWAKVRSHPWWPGQIFDPSNASEKARRYSKKDGFLIAYFGDKTFAWIEAPRIKPFQMNFSQMEKQSSTEAFSHAVDCALEEVSRRVEFGLACSCLSPEVYDKIKTQIVVNGGIREESSRRDGGDESSSVASFTPLNMLKNVKAVAKYPYGGIDRLEFVIARAQLLAISRWKGFYCLPEFQMLGGSLEDGADITGTVESKYSEDSVCVNEQFPVIKGKLVIQDNSSRKRKEISGDGVSSSKKERCLSDLMSRSHSNLSNGKGEPEAKVGRHSNSSSLKKRKALDSVPDVSVENKKVSPSTKKQFSRVGESLRRVANQLAMPSPIVKDGFEENKGNNGSNKRSTRSNSEKSQRSTRRKIIPTEYSPPNEILSQIYMACRDPVKGYNLLASSVSFLTEFRNSFCMEKSTSRDDQNPTRKVSSKKSGKNLPGVETTETSEFGGTEDSYWRDMIVQSNTEEQVLFEPEIPKENGSPTVVPEATLESGQGLDLEQKTAVIDRESEIKPEDTEVLKKSKRAKVVFKRRSDAETAFSSSGKFSTFGPSLVSYRLNYLPSTSRKSPISATKRSKKAATSVEGNGG